MLKLKVTIQEVYRFPILPPLQEHNVVFTILKEDANLKYSQSQAGKLLLPALSCWESKACAAGWNFKWSLNGIQPQRAVVMVTQDITIPTNKAFIFQ